VLECIGRIDFTDSQGYKDYEYFFFNVIPSAVSGANEEVTLRAESFPNPFVDEIFIFTKTAEVEEIELVDMKGDRVDFTVKQEENSFTISPKQKINPGVYFVKLSNKRGVTTLKTVKTVR